MPNSLKEKLSKVASREPSRWKENAKYRRDNREWLKKSSAIAIAVLEALKAQKLSQKDLADAMNLPPLQINKIVKGKENLTLETISNLEKTLGLKIINEKVGSETSGGYARKEYKKGKTNNVTIVKKLSDYNNQSAFKKKAENAVKFLKKHGLPESFKKKK